MKITHCSIHEMIRSSFTDKGTLAADFLGAHSNFSLPCKIHFPSIDQMEKEKTGREMSHTSDLVLVNRSPFIFEILLFPTCHPFSVHLLGISKSQIAIGNACKRIRRELPLRARVKERERIRRTRRKERRKTKRTG